MNKNQEALNRLHYFNYFGDDGTDSFNHKQHDEDIDTLQELVDKETPHELILHGDQAVCQSCGRSVEYDLKHGYLPTLCFECGEPVNWSKDENK